METDTETTMRLALLLAGCLFAIVFIWIGLLIERYNTT